ncbi:hypothetical protein ACNJX9_33375 [Bradyrhizobium sp. DASA03076]|uniref:Uncharacterized protein n=1 Tax=Bradyrhizobium manausense TaxID=989370 RepID=A0A0R3E4F3_9BRAD|nr:hypothetical protein [Bradyrhizobium manausense]KRQ17065.1 hypothetical protein AOQ71_04225 [Bradyrhizobium manausense]
MHIVVCIKKVLVSAQMSVHAVSKTIMPQTGKSDLQDLFAFVPCDLRGSPPVPNANLGRGYTARLF